MFLIPDVQEEFSPKRERSSSRLQEEPEPPEIKEEQEELHLQCPEEPDGSTLTSLAVKREVKDEEDISDDQQEASGGQSVLNTGTGITFVWIIFCLSARLDARRPIAASHC